MTRHTELLSNIMSDAIRSVQAKQKDDETLYRYEVHYIAKRFERKCESTRMMKCYPPHYDQ